MAKKRKSLKKRAAASTSAMRAKYSSMVDSAKASGRKARERYKRYHVKSLVVLAVAAIAGGLAFRYARGKGWLPALVFGVPVGFLAAGATIAAAWVMGIGRSAALLGAAAGIGLTEAGDSLFLPDTSGPNPAGSGEPKNDNIIDIDFEVLDDIARKAA